MSTTLSFTEDQVYIALRGLLMQMMPNTAIIRAQTNRVPEPTLPDFITFTPILRARLSTNVDDVFDVIFDGSIAGNVLTVNTLYSGPINIGAPIYGVGVAPITAITGIGTGGYTVTPPQTVPATTLYAGIKTALGPVRFDIQLDVHGPASADNTQVIATLFWDEFATSYFDACGLDIQALYVSEPRQVPFVNAEQQWEFRWTVDVSLQVNQRVQVPQQFADQLHTGLIEADTYPL